MLLFPLLNMKDFSVARQLLVSQGLVSQASRSLSGAPHSVGPLWTSDPTRRRVLYVTHNTQKRQAPMLPAGSERAIAANERLESHILDREATGIG